MRSLKQYFYLLILLIPSVGSSMSLTFLPHFLSLSLSRQLRSDPLLTYWPRTLISLECFSLSHLWDQIVSINFIVCALSTHTHHHQTSTYQKVAHKNFNRTHSLSHSHNKVLNYKSFSVGSTRKKHEKEKNRARAILYVERTITVNCEMNTKCLGPCNFWSLCKCETMASI